MGKLKLNNTERTCALLTYTGASTKWVLTLLSKLTWQAGLTYKPVMLPIRNQAKKE